MPDPDSNPDQFSSAPSAGTGHPTANAPVGFDDGRHRCEEGDGEEDTGQEDTGQEDTGQEDTGQEDTGQEDTGQEDRPSLARGCNMARLRRPNVRGCTGSG